MDCSFGSYNKKCAVLFTGNNYADGYKTITFEGSSNYNSKVTFPNDYANGSVNNTTFNGYRLHLNNCFRDCYNYNQPVVIPNCVDDISYMFAECYNFNKKVTLPNTLWQCTHVFENCNNFNYPINIPNNSTTNFYRMFANCAFNQNVVLYDVDKEPGGGYTPYWQILNACNDYKAAVTCYPNMGYYGEVISDRAIRYHGAVIFGDASIYAGQLCGRNGDASLLGIMPSENTYGARVIFPYYDNAEIKVDYDGYNYNWVVVKNGSLPKINAFTS